MRWAGAFHILTLLAWSIHAVSCTPQLESPLESYQGDALKENIAIVPVLRSGLGLVEGMFVCQKELFDVVVTIPMASTLSNKVC